MYKIVVSGPESTGKTILSAYLAEALETIYIPEYARAFIEQLDRPYRYEDVEHIGNVQCEQFREYSAKAPRVLIMDTFLVITKIWFREVYGRQPDWIDNALQESGIDLFLLCYPDLDWEADTVRENPGQRRNELFNAYQHEIDQLGVPSAVIKGTDQERFTCALEAVWQHIPELNR